MRRGPSLLGSDRDPLPEPTFVSLLKLLPGQPVPFLVQSRFGENPAKSVQPGPSTLDTWSPLTLGSAPPPGDG